MDKSEVDDANPVISVNYLLILSLYGTSFNSQSFKLGRLFWAIPYIFVMA